MSLVTAADLPAQTHTRAPSKAFETDAVSETLIWAAPIVLLGLVLSVQTWGLPALTIFALTLVPLMFSFFIYICWPFPSRR